MVTRFSKLVLKLFICIPFLLIFLAPNVQAMSSLGLVGAKQDYYIFDAKPGDSKTFEFSVQNRDTKDSTVLLYPSDQLTGEKGGSAYTPMSQKPFLYGTWLNQDRYTLTLAPGEEKKVTYTITVPQDVKPGQYIAVVALGETGIRSTEDKVTDGSETYTVRSDYDIISGKQIVVNVELGQAKKEISTESLSFGYSPAGTPEALVTLKNSGTILQKPKLEISIKSVSGKTYPVLLHNNSLSFYGGTTQTMRIPYSEVLPPGNYIATIKVEGDGTSETKDFKFTIEKEVVKEAVNQAVSEEKMVVSEDVLGVQEKYVWLGGGFILLLIIVNVFVFLFVLRRKKEKKAPKGENPSSDHNEIS